LHPHSIEPSTTTAPSGRPWEQESGSAYTIKQPTARSHLVPMLCVSLLSGGSTAPLKNDAAPLKNATLGKCLVCLVVNTPLLTPLI
ncbi:unnamed protein product, partial [Staurois parvus]